MPGIALHNCRGFKKTLIPISQVNFFVGENSTGKTTVMSLIEILSSPRFYFSEELASEYCDFTSYEDIASDLDDSGFFSIGYFRNLYSPSKTGVIDALAFHFINKDGAVKLQQVRFVSNSYLINAVFKQDKISITVRDAEVAHYDSPVQITAELMWGSIKKLTGSLVKKIEYKYSDMVMPSPLTCALNVLAIEAIRKSDSDPIVRTRFNPSLFPLPTWIAPIRAKPQRINTRHTKTYTPEGDHIPSIIRHAYGKKQDPHLRNRLIEVVSNFGTESHLFDELKVKEYGADISSPFEIHVKFANLEHKISNVGYGVSQALPVLIEVAVASDQDSFIIQQPEVHLHPRAQAAFGNLFFEMATERKHRFNIETHSDFLIDRFRWMLSQSKKRNKPITQILFFSKKGNNTNTVESIQINRDGTYPSGITPEFKNFFLTEELNLLSI